MAAPLVLAHAFRDGTSQRRPPLRMVPLPNVLHLWSSAPQQQLFAKDCRCLVKKMNVTDVVDMHRHGHKAHDAVNLPAFR